MPIKMFAMAFIANTLDWSESQYLENDFFLAVYFCLWSKV